MDFKEALELTQRLNETEKDKIYLHQQGSTTIYLQRKNKAGDIKSIPQTIKLYTFIWQGYILVSNITAKFFDKYLSQIQSGELKIGPAVYEMNGNLQFIKDYVGIWRKN
ncbi:MAG: hypothetical protein WC389_13865 [Lutibacter sp.]|jgi:hypothetical protein